MAEKARAKCAIRVLEPLDPKMQDEVVDSNEGREENKGNALPLDEHGDGLASSGPGPGGTEGTRTRVLMEIGPFC